MVVVVIVVLVLLLLVVVGGVFLPAGTGRFKSSEPAGSVAVLLCHVFQFSFERWSQIIHPRLACGSRLQVQFPFAIRVVCRDNFEHNQIQSISVPFLFQRMIFLRLFAKLATLPSGGGSIS